jgi:predicted chitinase
MISAEEFERFFAYYERQEQQRAAVHIAYRVIVDKAPELLNPLGPFVTRYRTRNMPAPSPVPQMITREQVAYVSEWSADKFDSAFMDDLNRLCALAGVSSVNARRLFLAHTCHETGRYRFMQEQGGPAYCARMYDNRPELGNGVGDGYKFRGCGVIQLTGRFNHQRFSLWLDKQKISDRKVMEQGTDYTANRYPFLSAAAWIEENRWIESLNTGDLERSTRVLNGGLNGLEDRRYYYGRAVRAIPETTPRVGTLQKAVKAG